MFVFIEYNRYKITHSSDYFQKVYLWAIQLIKDNLANVYHQKVEEMCGFNVVPDFLTDPIRAFEQYSVIVDGTIFIEQ